MPINQYTFVDRDGVVQLCRSPLLFSDDEETASVKEQDNFSGTHPMNSTEFEFAADVLKDSVAAALKLSEGWLGMFTENRLERGFANIIDAAAKMGDSFPRM